VDAAIGSHCAQPGFTELMHPAQALATLTEDHPPPWGASWSGDRGGRCWSRASRATSSSCFHPPATRPAG